ncbi:prenyltransferase [Candidatus Bathyarchaeota archaeon]|nr:prenyltransferase [Candidatus Bathyarchaeota archaeon]
MSRGAALLRVIRPHIVLGGFLGYLSGALYAAVYAMPVDLWAAALGYFTILFIDLSTHYSNDYYDAERDRQANWKPFGGSNVLIRQPSLAPWLLRVAGLCSVASVVFASLLVSRGVGWHVLALTLIGNVMGWAYSHPATQLKARGLGEAGIAVGTGFIIPAIGYMAVKGSLTTDLTLFTVPLILYGFVLSVGLEIPDHRVDAENGIRNLSVRFTADKMMRICLAMAFSVTVYLLAGFVPAVDGRLLALASLPPLSACLFSVFTGFESRRAVESNTFLLISGLFVFIIGLDVILFANLLSV